MSDVWLWLESKRLKTEFHSPRNYVLSPQEKFPGTSTRRNRLLNARIFGPAALFALRPRNPREAVVNNLVALLWDQDLARHMADTGSLLGTQGTQPDNRSRRLKLYKRAWELVR